jgi:drug/metabolite transporter (DMT)-like permease
MYLILILAAFLFAVQFLFNQQYRKLKGEGLNATMTFSLYTSAISFVILFVLGGFQLHITWFSLLIAVLYAAVCLLSSYAGLKAFGTANLSVYSIFMMLGGMLLPFAYGILFANEALSFAKALSILLICTAVGCSFEKGAGGKNAYRFYAAIFVLNGLVGVLSKIHLSVPALAVDSYSFMATIQLALLAMCLLYCFITRQGIPKQSGKLYLCLSGYAVCNGIGNLFCQIALTSLPASVQYPIITGGVMVFSTLISLVRREPIGGKTYLAAVLACLSTILILF